MTPKSKSHTFWNDLGSVLSPRTAVLFIGSLVIPAAAFMLYPFLTIYFTHELHDTVAEAGLLLSIRFLSSAVFGFLGSWSSGRWGLLRTYYISSLLTAGAIALLAFQHQVIPIILLLLVMGVSGSTVMSMIRGLSNIGVPAEHRGTALNVIHWLTNVGMAVAMPFSALLLHGGHSRTPFYVAAGAYAVMVPVVALFFGKNPPAGAGKPDSPANAKTAGLRGILRQDIAFTYLMGSFILWALVEMQFESNVPLDLSYHLPHGTALYGILGGIDMVIVFVLQLVVSHWLSHNKSPWYGYAGFVMLGGLIVGGLWQSVMGWTISIILLSVGEVFSISQIMNLMGILPKEGQQGSYFAIFGMAQGLATFLAYSLGGVIYQWLHPAVLFSLCLPAAIISAVLYRNARVRAYANAPISESSAV